MTPITTTTLPLARQYRRVSDDDSGRQRSVTEQDHDNLRTWQGQLAFNGEDYAEADAISASPFATKARGGFDALMTDLRSGQFGADVLVLWEPSRGSRRVSEWCSLLDACADAGVRIAVTTHGRIYDPSNGRDERALLEDAIDSQYESRKISDRVRRAMEANARDGRPRGATPFGYRREHALIGGKAHLIGQVIDPEAGPVAAELFHRLHRGDTLKAIARDWQARGVVSPHTGKPYSAQDLRTMALSPSYAGKRHYHGELIEGDWPPITDLSIVLSVQSMLRARRKGAMSSGKPKHLLSGIARTTTGELMYVERRGQRYRYRSGSTTIDRDRLDAAVEAVVLGYLSRPDNYRRLAAEDGNDAALTQAREDRAKLRAELDELYADVEAGKVSRRMAEADERRLTAALASAEARVNELTVPDRLSALISPGADVEARWKATTIEVRRQVVRLLATPDILGQLVILPATKRGDIIDRICWDRT